MANPGTPFQVTDYIVDDTLPPKRLVFAGVSGGKCFVHYEQEGFAPYYVLALFDVTSKDKMKPVWHGSCQARAAALENLRSWLVQGNCSTP